MIADVLAARMGAGFKSHKSGADVLDGRLAGTRVVLAKPRSYMNLSGGPVAALSRFFSVEPARVVALHDELDLPYGTIRVKFGGGEGGHNGLRSISAALGTKDYLRVRFGIGRPPGRLDPADYVLRDFSAAERKDLGRRPRARRGCGDDADGVRAAGHPERPALTRRDRVSLARD